MDGRLYTLEFENATITTAGGDRDFFYVAPADDKPIKIVGWDFAQFSDLGDAQSEVLRLRIIRGHTTAGTGGTAVTASSVFRLHPSDPDPSFTARINDPGIATGGTTFVAWSGGYNIALAPCPYFLPEKLWIPCTQAQGSIVLRLMAGPADDIVMSGTLWVFEQG